MYFIPQHNREVATTTTKLLYDSRTKKLRSKERKKARIK
jgi:hypothetical protein